MYDRVHYLLTFGGTAVSGLEEWQTGLRFAQDGNHDEQDLLDALNDISVADCFNALGNVISQTTTGLTYVNTLVARFAKLAVIKTDGHYAGAPKIHEGTIAGKNNVAITPAPQLSMVATLGTSKQFGQAQRGRMYWPPPINMVHSINSATGHVASVDANALRDLIKNAIGVCEGEVSTVNVPVSAAVMSKAGSGTTNFITEVSVGLVVDTQRRRRANLQEAYLPTPAARGTRVGDFAAPAHS